MRPKIKNIMLASNDQVAIDAVAAKLMVFHPMTSPYIWLAHEAGLGAGRPDEICLAGDDISGENWGFSVGDNMASRVGDLCWFGSLRWAQRLLFQTPLVHLFVFGSECYHDWYRWPRKDKRVFTDWAMNTCWGRPAAPTGAGLVAALVLVVLAIQFWLSLQCLQIDANLTR
jgi:hypothetical protein